MGKEYVVHTYTEILFDCKEKQDYKIFRSMDENGKFILKKAIQAQKKTTTVFSLMQKLGPWKEAAVWVLKE